MYNFQGTAADAAGGLANVGRGKLAPPADERVHSPLARAICREARANTFGEQQLLDHILEVVRGAGYALPRALIVNYYVALKTNPFVILAGAAGQGKKELARLFAEALVGHDSSQYLQISRTGLWAGGTGQDQYYRSMQEQFSSWRFLELLQEAAAPSNLGKIYMVCFDAVYPADLEYYFDMLQVAPDGTKWLKLPGFPPECQPVIPPNVYITAVLDADDAGTTLGRNVLRHAGLIEFRLPPEDYRPALRLLGAPGVPPTGYQRLWQRSSLHSLAEARARLADVLGYEQMARLHYSADLALLFWRSGQALMKETLDELTIFVANSFDHDGRGLFDPDNPQRNAEIAYDAQVIQRTLWRLNTLGDDELRHDLLEYLDRLARDDAPREQGTRREAVHTAGTQAPIMRPITQQAVA